MGAATTPNPRTPNPHTAYAVRQKQLAQMRAQARAAAAALRQMQGHVGAGVPKAGANAGYINRGGRVGNPQHNPATRRTAQPAPPTIPLPTPTPIGPGAGPPNTVPVSPTYTSLSSYLSTGPWQPNAPTPLAALPPPGVQPGAPTQPLAATVPPGTVPPGTQPATPPPGGNNTAPIPGQRALQRSLEGVSVRLDRLSGAMQRRVPTPGGVAPLIWTLAVLLIAVVPVNANGATRLKLLWEVITGAAWLPNVQYGGAASQAAIDQNNNPAREGGAILQPPPGGGPGPGNGLGGLGVLGRGVPVRVPTSLPIGPWAAGTGALRVPGRSTRGGGHSSRVAQIAHTGLNVGNGGVRIVPPSADQGANPLPYHPTASPQAPLIFPPGTPRRGGPRR